MEMMSVDTFIAKIPVRLAIVMFSGMWLMEFFPDPYHKDGLVDVFTWVYREIDVILKRRREENGQEIA